MKKLFFLVAIVGFLTSCNVTESIIFNKDMSGLYTSSFDMSPMLKIANSQGSSSETEENAQKIDTTIVFNDLYVTHKDSVAALSADKRARLDKLRGITMTIHTD